MRHEQHLPAVMKREWLLVNGMGGYAMGDDNGACTRTRHYLLAAPVRPPLQRAAFVRTLTETILTDNGWLPLREMCRLHYENRRGLPVFVYESNHFTLLKHLWMADHFHGVFVRYELQRGELPVEIRLMPCLDFRDLETETALSEFYTVRRSELGADIYADVNDKPFRIAASPATGYVPVNRWHEIFLEDDSGTPQRYEVYLPFVFEHELAVGRTLTVLLAHDGPESWEAEAARHETPAPLLFASEEAQALSRAEGLPHLTAGAHAFLIRRPTILSLDNTTLLAGYPNLADSGREAMLALPGLLIAAGEFERAKQVFSIFLKHVHHGLIPNFFSKRPESPNYDSIDATLWLFVALYEYWRASRDLKFLEENYSFLLEMLNCHLRSLTPGIKFEPKTGFLYALETQRAMTWMNGRLGNWLATPRSAFAVEVQALWHNTLCIMAEFSHLLGKETGESKCRELAAQVEMNLSRSFAVPATDLIYDSLPEQLMYEGKESIFPAGDDTLRPNAVIAVGLPFTAFSAVQIRALVDLALRWLITPFGLRTLAPDHPAYCGQCWGPAKHRVSAQHNGAAHPWLIVPFVRAYLRVYHDRDFLRGLFAPLFEGRNSPCDGFIAQMYDGDSPHAPAGAPAFAASSGAVLQAWEMLKE